MARSKKFKLEIELGNDAMQTSMDIQVALKNVVYDLSALEDDAKLPTGKSRVYDMNGNTVGFYRFVNT